MIERHHLRLLPLEALLQMRNALNDIISEKTEQNRRKDTDYIPDSKCSKRVKNVLNNYNIKYWSDLAMNYTKSDLRKFRNLGAIGIYEIKSELGERGLFLNID